MKIFALYLLVIAVLAAGVQYGIALVDSGNQSRIQQINVRKETP